MTTGALTQTKEEDKRERRDRDKAEKRPDNGRSRVAVTGRYSTNAVTVPAEMVGKGGERLGASLVFPERWGPRNRGTRGPEGCIGRGVCRGRSPR